MYSAEDMQMTEWEEKLDILKSRFQSSDIDGSSLNDSYHFLNDVVKNQPNLSSNVLDTFKRALKNEKNNFYSLKGAYYVLGDIATAQPNLASEVFDTFKLALQNENNNSDSLEGGYYVLGYIAESQPGLSYEVFDTLKLALQNKKNDRDSLKMVCHVLARIAIPRPNLASEVFETFKLALQNENNDKDSLKEIYTVLRDIAKAQPNLASEVFDTLKFALQNTENASYSLTVAYIGLGEIAKAQPNLASEVFDTFKLALQNTENASYSLTGAYVALGEIANSQPNLASEVLDTLKLALQNKNNNKYSLKEAYYILMKMAEVRPNLASEVFDNLKIALKRNNYSLGLPYNILGKIAKAQPTLTSKVLDTFKHALKKGKNDSDSLNEAYPALGEITKAQPNLASEVFDTLKFALKNGKNNYYSLREVYPALGEIVKAQPNLASEVMNIVLSKNLQDRVDDDNGRALSVCAQCMKYHKPEDFYQDIDRTVHNDKILQAAYNVRFSTNDEIKYAYERYGLDKLSSMSLSAQHKCMNVMMGKLEQAKGIINEDTNKYRKEGYNNEIYASNKDWLVSASFRAAEIFGSYFPSYIKQTEKYLSVHDAVYWLPDKMSESKRESFRIFVKNHLIDDSISGQKKVHSLSEMGIIARNWDYINVEKGKLSYKEALSICKNRKYEDQEDDNFALEAARWAVKPQDYKNWEGIYHAGLMVPEPFDSSKEFKFGQYTGKFLPRDDVRVGFFGQYTDCCQHFDGIGRECAISTVKDPYSQLFVIENKEGQIIAGSWVWENKEGKYRDVCFDNIEAIGDQGKNPLINTIYETAGKYLTQECNCHKVTIGKGNSDADISKYKQTEDIGLPKQYGDGYSDADGGQVLLAENLNAKPLDKSQESKRFIRDVCFLDINAMGKISKECFPQGDERLQVPKNLSGLALVDEAKGVVGYCLYDKEERNIYDMAVLPEYRTDKNASSKKLFGELIKRIHKIGGEWSAELRDKTTYRYLEAMSQRGLVKFENHGVDHEMSDGSKVYSVTFSVPKQTKSSQKASNMVRSGGRE